MLGLGRSMCGAILQVDLLFPELERMTRLPFWPMEELALETERCLVELSRFLDVAHSEHDVIDVVCKKLLHDPSLFAMKRDYCFYGPAYHVLSRLSIRRVTF